MKNIHLLLTSIALLFSNLVMSQTNVTVDVTSVSSYNIPWTVGQTYNITFSNRIFYPGVWEFICLPFDASQATLDDAFGIDNYEVQQFSELVDGKNFHFLKMETPQITAGYPYLIRTKSRVTNPTFNNVTVTLNSDPTTFYGTESMTLKGVILSHNWDLASGPNYQMTEGMLKKLGWPNSGSVIATAAYISSSDATVVPAFTPEQTTFEGLVFQDDEPMFVKIANRGSREHEHLLARYGVECHAIAWAQQIRHIHRVLVAWHILGKGVFTRLGCGLERELGAALVQGSAHEVDGAVTVNGIGVIESEAIVPEGAFLHLLRQHDRRCGHEHGDNEKYAFHNREKLILALDYK